jgi:uncharacterized protein (DUF433 family)
MARIDRLAHRIGESRNSVAERYLAEGVRRDEFPEIDFRDGALGRRATVVGTRLDVWQVVETVRSHQDSVDAAAAYLDQPVHKVRAAVRYYAMHREEIDLIAEREREAAERAEELWRAERGALGS